MLVKDILEIIRLRIRNVALSKETGVMLNVIYLGVSDLYNRFNLSIKSEMIKTTELSSFYEVKDPSVCMILGVYDMDGKELRSSDILNSRDWEVKQVNYRSFVLHHPKDDVLQVVYKASPHKINNEMDRIDLPDTMIEALMLYCLYVLHSTVTSFTAKDSSKYGMTEADYIYQKYLGECANLENMGYKVNINTESISLVLKGYV